ncbi:MAG: hypothetical protein U0790_03945 [Isosphaeraceae bacterium]
MPTIPQRIASAFAVLCGRYGEVTEMARDREQSRRSLYREAEQVVEAVDGAAARARIEDLQRQLAEQRAEVQALQGRLKRAIEMTPDKQHEFATVAQAEGVSLSVARRLLRVVQGSKAAPSVPALGRATREAGHRAGPLLEVLDEAARPGVKQATADEIFFAKARPDGRRAREPLLDDGSDGQGARRCHMGGGIRPTPGAPGGGPRRWYRPGQRGEARARTPSRRRSPRP